MKKYLFIIITILFLQPLHAQDIFISKGQIEFEKKVNTRKNLEAIYKSDDENNGDDDFFAQIIKQVPEWKTTYFNLYFDGSKTLYKPGREVTVPGPKGPDWFQDPAQNNVVFCNLDSKQNISQKSVYEATFLITDSLRTAKWKITNDSRDIAGFNCRKATTIIMDSVFVVAFYTDQITTSGGPESFNGLPGMILGLAIPRIHTTWFATKVESTDPAPAVFTVPTKGKKGSNADIMTILQSAFKNSWNKKYGQYAQWIIAL
jgi:GLPGLI family protein